MKRILVPIHLALPVVGRARTTHAAEAEYGAWLRAVHWPHPGAVFPGDGDGDGPVHHGGQLVGPQGAERDRPDSPERV